jgi:hypothetical protein
MFTRRHYVAIAAVFNEVYSHIDAHHFPYDQYRDTSEAALQAEKRNTNDMMRAMASMLRKDNARFDPTRFRKAVERSTK